MKLIRAQFWKLSLQLFNVRNEESGSDSCVVLQWDFEESLGVKGELSKIKSRFMYLRGERFSDDFWAGHTTTLSSSWWRYCCVRLLMMDIQKGCWFHGWTWRLWLSNCFIFIVFNVLRAKRIKKAVFIAHEEMCCWWTAENFQSWTDKHEFDVVGCFGCRPRNWVAIALLEQETSYLNWLTRAEHVETEWNS